MNRGMQFTIIHHEFHNENHYGIHHEIHRLIHHEIYPEIHHIVFSRERPGALSACLFLHNIIIII